MKIIMILTLTTMLSLCKKDQQDEELHLQQTPYIGDELRIDGFYYSSYNEGKSTRVFFLYSNGIILGGSSYKGDDWEQKLISDIVSGMYYETSLKYKSAWGLFEIKDSTIIFEKWYTASPGPRVTIAQEGRILCDTTFHINRSFRFGNGQLERIRERDDLYHFRQFSPKPDSINPFIP
ncbi:MAG: hypothetical protein LAT54_08920 [Cryomorphaceae bacterium]|nr:hypothetical protein [Cryomorphaceae bacterium]